MIHFRITLLLYYPLSSVPMSQPDHRILPLTAKWASDMLFVGERLTVQQRRDLLAQARQMNAANRDSTSQNNSPEPKYLGKKKYNKAARQAAKSNASNASNASNNHQRRPPNPRNQGNNKGRAPRSQPPNRSSPANRQPTPPPKQERTEGTEGMEELPSIAELTSQPTAKPKSKPLLSFKSKPKTEQNDSSPDQAPKLDLAL